MHYILGCNEELTYIYSESIKSFPEFICIVTHCDTLMTFSVFAVQTCQLCIQAGL